MTVPAVAGERYATDPRRINADVNKELMEWWHAAQHFNTGDEDLDGDGIIDETEIGLDQLEYAAYYRRLVYAFNDHNDDEGLEGNKLDVEAAKHSLAVDWISDSGGDGLCCRKDFLDSVFDIGFTWTVPDDEEKDATAAEICAYLAALRPRIFDVDQHDVDVFLTDDWGPNELPEEILRHEREEAEKDGGSDSTLREQIDKEKEAQAEKGSKSKRNPLIYSLFDARTAEPSNTAQALSTFISGSGGSGAASGSSRVSGGVSGGVSSGVIGGVSGGVSGSSDGGGDGGGSGCGNSGDSSGGSTGGDGNSLGDSQTTLTQSQNSTKKGTRLPSLVDSKAAVGAGDSSNSSEGKRSEGGRTAKAGRASPAAGTPSLPSLRSVRGSDKDAGLDRKIKGGQSQRSSSKRASENEVDAGGSANSGNVSEGGGVDIGSRDNGKLASLREPDVAMSPSKLLPAQSSRKGDTGGDTGALRRSRQSQSRDKRKQIEGQSRLLHPTLSWHLNHPKIPIDPHRLRRVRVDEGARHRLRVLNYLTSQPPLPLVRSPVPRFADIHSPNCIFTASPPSKSRDKGKTKATAHRQRLLRSHASAPGAAKSTFSAPVRPLALEKVIRAGSARPRSNNISAAKRTVQVPGQVLQPPVLETGQLFAYHFRSWQSSASLTWHDANSTVVSSCPPFP